MIVRRPDGCILLAHQPYRELPFLPGGLLKRGEAVLAGAHRELLEETGLDLPVVDLGRPQVRPHARWATFYALAEVDDGTAATARPRGAEVTALSWAYPDALPAVDPAVRAALEQVRSVPVVLDAAKPSARSQPAAVVHDQPDASG